MKRTIPASITLVLNLLAPHAFAEATEQSKSLESVLDKLEHRLLDRESQPLTYDEKKAEARPADIRAQKEPASAIEIKNDAPIGAQTPNSKALNQIQKKINEYDSEIDILESETRKLRTDVVEASAVDNAVTLEVKLKDPGQSTLRTLTARLDGSLIFNQTDPAGIWIPGKSVTVFQGPTQPGEHRIDITATTMNTNRDGLPVQNWQQKLIKETFTVTVPDGKQRRSWTIEFDASEAEGSKNVAKLIEAKVDAPLPEGAKQ